MSTKILLVDDHPLVLVGLHNLLQSEARFTVVGETTDGAAALDMLRKLVPDVFVVDLMMPGMDGFEVLRQCQALALKTRVIVLSMHMNEAYMLEALRCGAMGYVLKDALPDDLIKAIETVSAGRRYLSPMLRERVFQSYLHKRPDTRDNPFMTLTGREREVLSLAAGGQSNPQIAATLAISPRTVEIHRANMMRKLSLRHQSDLVHYALKQGLIATA